MRGIFSAPSRYLTGSAEKTIGIGDPTHPNSKRLIHLVQVLLKLAPRPIAPDVRPALRCPCCGGEMKIVRTRIKPVFARHLEAESFVQRAAGREMAV